MRAAKAKTAHFDEYIDENVEKQKQLIKERKRKLKKVDTIFIYDPKLLVKLSKNDN